MITTADWFKPYAVERASMLFVGNTEMTYVR